MTATTRIAVFGSFYRGYYVLSELLRGALKDRVRVVGVATDDPSQSFVHPHLRVWHYPHAAHEETMVRELAMRHDIPVDCGRVSAPAFQIRFEEDWRPDLCIMATYGQRVPPRIFERPALGFFNLHPCIDDGWPSRFAGPNPFQALLDDHRDEVRIAMHRIDEAYDAGDLIAYSEAIAMPSHANVVDMHKITSVAAARLAATQIAVILDRKKP